MNFECHLTIDVPLNQLGHLREEIENKIDWKFSRITDDPLLGEGMFCYATAHFTYAMQALCKTEGLSEELRRSGFNVVRRKIEIVMFDERKIDGEWKQLAWKEKK